MTRFFQTVLLVVLTSFISVLGCATAFAVKGQDGKEQVEQNSGLVTTAQGLPIKLIVTKNTAVYRPELEKGEEMPIEPFNFYWKLIPATGKEHEGKKWFCFGTPDGKKIGWIKEDDCQEWKTFFCYDPVAPPTEKVHFAVYAKEDKECKGKPIAEFLKSAQDNQKRLALITDSIDGTPVPLIKSTPVYVAAFLGNTHKAETDPSTKTSPNAPLTARDLTVDFVFVIDTTGSMMPAIEACRSIMKDTVALLAGNEILKDKIRFGVVEFRDVDSYVSKVTLPLTADYVAVQKTLDALQDGGGGDEAEEGLAGLKTAIDDAGWAKNAVKYLFLIGDAPMKGKGEKLPGGSGLSFEDIQKRVKPKSTEINKDPNGGTIETQTALAAISMISMFVVSNDTASNPGVPEGKEQFKRIADTYIEADLRNAAGKEKAMDDVKKFCLAVGASKEVATKGASPDVIKELKDRSKKGDAYAKGLYDVLITLPEDEAIYVGCARDQNATSDSIAIKRVMILRDDTRRVVSQLKSLNTRLNRQGLQQNNTASIVESALEAFGENLSGSTLAPNANLEEVIRKDFPLAIRALDITPQGIAAMAPEEFNKWKQRLVNTTNRLNTVAETNVAEANDIDRWYRLELPLEIKKQYEKSGESEPEYRFVNATYWDRD